MKTLKFSQFARHTTNVYLMILILLCIIFESCIFMGLLSPSVNNLAIAGTTLLSFSSSTSLIILFAIASSYICRTDTMEKNLKWTEPERHIEPRSKNHQVKIKPNNNTSTHDSPIALPKNTDTSIEFLKNSSKKLLDELKEIKLVIDKNSSLNTKSRILEAEILEKKIKLFDLKLQSPNIIYNQPLENLRESLRCLVNSHQSEFSVHDIKCIQPKFGVHNIKCNNFAANDKTIGINTSSNGRQSSDSVNDKR